MTLIHLTSKNFKKEVTDSKLPVVIDFYADWCGPCKMMAPIFEELAGDYKGKVNLIKLDTEHETDLAQKFEVRGIPTLVVMNKGKEIGRMVGALAKESLKKKIDEIISKSK